MQEFEDKVAVVTGGAHGMGLAYANRAADEGMKVVICDIDAEPLAMAEAQIKEKGAPVLAQRLDIANPDSVEKFADETFNVFGNVHLLFNNAGVGGPGGRPSWELSLGDWQWVVGVNLWGVIHCVRSFLPRMIEKGDEGHIVNTASQAAVNYGGGIYGVTKFGVMAFSESLYFELAIQESKVGVSVLCPGWVATDIADSNRHRPAEYGEPLGGKQPREGTDQMQAWTRQALATGYPTEYIADIVFQGIKDRQFYLLPAQEGMYEGMVRRHRSLESQTNPDVSLRLAATQARMRGQG
jgi:NAD(P)-dependent dehydrogenase (short-subunit alcohol dehydrogenase family)